MKAVILAGGLGTRFSEETDRIPKPMIEIGGKPILWHIMKIFSRHGVNDFIVCLGYRGYVIKEYFSNYLLHMSDVTFDIRSGGMEIHDNYAENWKITLVDTGPETMTGGRLRRVREHLVDDDAFCFTYGDGVSDVDITALIEFHKAHGKMSTVTAITPPGRYGSLVLDDRQVKGFSEKTDNDEVLINGGFFVLAPKVIDFIEEDATIWERGPMERLAADGEMMAYRHSGFWHAMDTLRDKRHLEGLWREDRAPWRTW